MMLDLYSGFGGASEAFVKAGWEVHRMDNNPAFRKIPHTLYGDVCALRPAWVRSIGPIDLLWASPPCLDFSLAYNAPGPKAARAREPFEPDMTLIKKAISIRDRYEPRYWCFECVVGAIMHFEPFLGPPTQIIGPFVLWHNLPQIIIPKETKFDSKTALQERDNPLRPNLRARVPLFLSEAVLEAVMTPTLGAWT